MIDVAIVGAGPAGLHTAKELAGVGLDVHVFEEHPVVGVPTHCTGVVSLELSRFTQLPGHLILNTLARAQVHGPSGAKSDIVWDSSEAEKIVVIDRSAFDQQLALDALWAGATLHTSSPVHRIAVEPKAVRIDVAGGSVQARSAVLACGVSYRFHRQLGLDLPTEIVHTAQIEVDADLTDYVELHVGRQVAPEGFLWAVPLTRAGRSRLKVGILTRGPAELWLQRFLARPTVRRRLTLSSVPDILTRVLPLKPVSRSYLDRVLLVGDAGGFTKPMTGGGIFYSLLTASAAAKTLVGAFRADRFDSAMLKGYERCWRAELDGDLRVSGWLRHVVTTCNDDELDGMVRALAADDVQAVIHRTARFNWHRGVIVALLAHRRFARLVFRSLLNAREESSQAR